MLPVIWIGGAIASALLYDARIAPIGLAKINPIPATPAVATARNAAVNPAAGKVNPPSTTPQQVPPVVPAITPPSGTVIDGHGTGVLPGAQQQVAPGFTLAQIQAAASQAALQMGGLGVSGVPIQTLDPTDPSVQGANATAAANNMAERMVAALNTPEAQRTPEMIALIQMVGASAAKVP